MDKIKGAIYGAIIGDAAGVPYEFQSASSIKSWGKIVPFQPIKFKTYQHVKYGTYSDDGSQILALMDYLSENKDILNFIDCLSTQWYKGEYWYKNDLFDIGYTTREAINSNLDGKRTEFFNFQMGDSNSAGNGSLMRTIPLSFINAENKYGIDLFDLSFIVSSQTHNHEIANMCCAIYNFAIKHLYLHSEKMNGDYIGSVLFKLENNDDFMERYEKSFNKFRKFTNLAGSGYSLDTLKTSFHCIEQTDSFEEAIKMAISFGNDTDTTACVTGGLAGCIYGYESIPEDWVYQLKNKKLIDEIYNKFLNFIK